MELEKYRERSSEERDLAEVCEKIWDDQVRADLIYKRNLMMCLQCLAFFNNEQDSDHPKDQTVAVQRYFVERNITSPIKLAELIKEALGANIKDPIKRSHLMQGPTKPSISQTHIANSPKRPHLITLDSVKMSQEKLADAKEIIISREEEIRLLRDQVCKLRTELGELYLCLFRDREASNERKKRTLRLTEQIASTCRSTCPWNPQQLDPGSNK